MLGKKKNEDYSAKAVKVGADGLTTIAQGTTVTGTVIVEGNLRLDGTVDGNISCKGKLVIGPQGKIKGDITCDAAVLHGMLQGDIHVTEELIMKSGCIMNGDVYTCKLEIESKARFNGTCNTTEKSLPAEGKTALPGKRTKEG